MPRSPLNQIKLYLQLEAVAFAWLGPAPTPKLADYFLFSFQFFINKKYCKRRAEGKKQKRGEQAIGVRKVCKE